MVRVELTFETYDEMLDALGLIPVAALVGAEEDDPDPDPQMELPLENDDADDEDDEDDEVNDDGLNVVPRARKIAAETGLDLTTVEGTGAKGRILVRDVQAALKAEAKAAVAEARDEPQETQSEPEPAPEKTYSLEDCRNALRDLMDTKGMGDARSVLDDFSVERVSDLTEDRFASFVEAARERAA